MTGAGVALKRSQALDFLRGIAVLLVICRHHPSSGALRNIGWVGVDLFFVLSGYLVSGLLFDEFRKTGRIKGWRFLARRGLKIYPLYYLFLLGTLAMQWAMGDVASLWHYAAEMLFVQNYVPGLWNHTWSLAVEEHFYIALTLGAFVFLRFLQGSRFIPFVRCCVVVMICCLVMRCWVSWSLPFDKHTHFFPTHLRLDSLLSGVLLSALSRWRPQAFWSFFRSGRLWKSTLIALVFAPLFFVPATSPWITSIGFTLIYLACAVLLGLVLTSRWASRDIQPISVRVLATVGFSSYAVYLVHLMLLHAARWYSGPIWALGSPIEFVVYALSSVAIGMAATKLIEQPVLRWRDRLFPKA